MLKLISLRSCIATLQFQTSHTLSIRDYNSSTRTLSPFRDMQFSVSALQANYQFLERLLEDRPNARIIHVLSHEQRRGFVPVFEDGEPYVDEFGYNVYLGKDVDWFGQLTDIDERYESPLPF